MKFKKINFGNLKTKYKFKKLIKPCIGKNYKMKKKGNDLFRIRTDSELRHYDRNPERKIQTVDYNYFKDKPTRFPESSLKGIKNLSYGEKINIVNTKICSKGCQLDI